MSTIKHNERCQVCKQAVSHLLAALFGSVHGNWDLDLPCRLEDYLNTGLADTLGAVHEALQKHRGFDQFVRSKKLARVDYFVPEKNLIVEFDETQHFTKPRGIALGLYPHGLDYGFPIERWNALCQKLDKRDNDPPYRDEQRAWYDTIRDFVPQLWGSGKTIRLYSRELQWCSMNPENEADLLEFKQIILRKGNDQC
jgi:hypothetical protein